MRGTPLNAAHALGMTPSPAAAQIAPAPQHEVPAPFPSADEHLAHVTLENAKRLYGQPLPQPVTDRLVRELREIAAAEASAHLLASADLFALAARDGVIPSMARGSTAGSLTAFCLGLTQFDPLESDRLLERYLATDHPEGRRPLPEW
jgi:DNA polymerase III alpha subunit